jgi:hypothetical protein
LHAYEHVSVGSPKNPSALNRKKNKTKNLLVIDRLERNGPCVALDSFKLHLRRGHLRLHFSDGHGRDFEGRDVMPGVAFASELVAEVARRKRGNLRGLSVDLGRGILRATVDGGMGIEVVRIEGHDFESSVRPSSGPLIAWAETNFDDAECVLTAEP